MANTRPHRRDPRRKPPTIVINEEGGEQTTLAATTKASPGTYFYQLVKAQPGGGTATDQATTPAVAGPLDVTGWTLFRLNGNEIPLISASIDSAGVMTVIGDVGSAPNTFLTVQPNNTGLVSTDGLTNAGGVIRS